jgi:glycosyltransferase involved in cell wall biosynthesis
MKLLIITQKVDIEDDILGFMHGWIEKLSLKFDKLDVICLFEGKHRLPGNIQVFSLGKEKDKSKIKYVLRFYKYIFELKGEYDGIFIHMNPIYVVLGGFFWKIWNKKIVLWYNHRYGSLITRVAIFLADNVFYTSPFSFASKFKKPKKMPAGVDTEIFKRDYSIKRILNSILYLGRISRIKNVDILIEVAKLLDKEGISFVLNIVGGPGEKDEEYFKKIKEMSADLEEKGKIRFLGKIPNYITPEIYNKNEIFINLTPSGSLDKTIPEAMACETMVLVSNRSFQELLPDYLLFKERNLEDLKNKIINIFNLTDEKKRDLGKELRESAIFHHGLGSLVEKIVTAFHN